MLIPLRRAYSSRGGQARKFQGVGGETDQDSVLVDPLQGQSSLEVSRINTRCWIVEAGPAVCAFHIITTAL
jgi:hypothetical protein